ncbi:hypothetical protein JNUCC0626_32915 [Lentzea sp. JNUCC 0626]|uniref:hypothetical protein n=1 Tax=Lentzea sp. JNUCC 0626 TaxID=3367513 RepID=UPI00374A5E91
MNPVLGAVAQLVFALALVSPVLSLYFARFGPRGALAMWARLCAQLKRGAVLRAIILSGAVMTVLFVSVIYAIPYLKWLVQQDEIMALIFVVLVIVIALMARGLIPEFVAGLREVRSDLRVMMLFRRRLDQGNISLQEISGHLLALHTAQAAYMTFFEMYRRDVGWSDDVIRYLQGVIRAIESPESTPKPLPREMFLFCWTCNAAVLDQLSILIATQLKKAEATPR